MRVGSSRLAFTHVPGHMCLEPMGGHSRTRGFRARTHNQIRPLIVPTMEKQMEHLGIRISGYTLQILFRFDKNSPGPFCGLPRGYGIFDNVC